MTPTIEEVKLVAADMCFAYSRNGNGVIECPSEEELQAFAQHWIEAGRKEQRESDAEICDNLHDTWKFGDGEDSNSGPKECAEAIRNNTGE